MKPGHNLWFIGVFFHSIIRIFFRTYLTGNAMGDRRDFGNDISQQNHEIEKLAIFIYYTTATTTFVTATILRV
jgi:hypothetical protein